MFNCSVKVKIPDDPHICHVIPVTGVTPRKVKDLCTSLLGFSGNLDNLCLEDFLFAFTYDGIIRWYCKTRSSNHKIRKVQFKRRLSRVPNLIPILVSLSIRRF